MRTLSHVDKVHQVRPHQSRIVGKDHFFQPAGHASFGAALDIVGFLAYELAHVQLTIYQYPESAFQQGCVCVP